MLVECAVAFTQKQRSQLLYFFLLPNKMFPSCSCILRKYCVPINLFQKNRNRKTKTKRGKGPKENRKRRSIRVPAHRRYTKQRTRTRQERSKRIKKKMYGKHREAKSKPNAMAQQATHTQQSRTLSLSHPTYAHSVELSCTDEINRIGVVRVCTQRFASIQQFRRLFALTHMIFNCMFVDWATMLLRDTNSAVVTLLSIGCTFHSLQPMHTKCSIRIEPKENLQPIVKYAKKANRTTITI